MDYYDWVPITALLNQKWRDEAKVSGVAEIEKSRGGRRCLDSGKKIKGWPTRSP